jgi:hypothetical protein
MNTEKQVKRPSHIVWQVIDEKQKQSRWIRVGAGWTNKDGSLYLRFDSYPVLGKVIIRLAVEKPDANEGGQK